MQKNINEFQFLMVRLKGWGGYERFECNFISIPYGAIKRVNNVDYLSASDRFQFLMVRLKATNIPELLKIQKFQFLMVRLKALQTSLIV